MSTTKQPSETSIEETKDAPKPKPSKDLTYFGAGGFVVGFPARDLSAAEIAALSPEGNTPKATHDWLIATGMYAAAQSTPESE